MVRAPLRVPRWPAAAPECPDFAAIRAEFEVPEEFPAAVLAEAGRRAAQPRLPELDATDVPLVTLDPVGSRDLDQAVHLAARGDGYRVSYAIADVGAVVDLGGALDGEARRRGQTLYSPDRRTPLHPPVLSEGAASLLPGELRAAALWTMDLDADGEPVRVDLRRARVRSRAQLDYPAVQAQADAGTLPEPLALLPAVGALLQRRAVERGAIELGTPDQEVEAAAGGGWTLALRGELPVEGWNAEISLLTGRCAATLMLEGGVGLLRTLPPAQPADVERLRRLAPALGVDWPAGALPGEVIGGLDAARPGHAAFLEEAVTLLRGAAYTAFDGGAAPDQPGHGGVGAPYAHVTAPLRRLVDRFGTEVCLALAAGLPPSDELRAALPELPALMAASDRRTRDVERAVIDATEAWLLRGREGATFTAVVVDAEDGRGTVVLDDLAIRGRCTGEGLRPGTRIRVRLEQADVTGRTVRFTAVGAP
ncbi:RNB domain-containing ribonuclease [Blastococcus sp. TML/M2B]|uniref:RNB domain-containing ribonuclease n=1 Tax=unclassified Blastococcus TaxID=2619396 RepID=UPI00190B4A84|nr:MULTISPECIES: RNB domain-containing ribonuclease [unclassified Blastococcus]MBN1094442.1 RNB domain-containing ribonuclease [Blastococcus sp. TML/M2B]MBN1095400.1 RNB domain-containing ribonuclease [Blastococcus sp. TML/C7B]